MQRAKQDLLKLVLPQFHQEFLDFVNNEGVSSPAFEEYLNNDLDAQEAVELALTSQMQLLHDAVRDVKEKLARNVAPCTDRFRAANVQDFGN